MKNQSSEIDKFNNDAEFWWNKESGPFKILHQINPLRLNFISQNSNLFFDSKNDQLEILDIGSGGGILSESLVKEFHSSNITGVEPGLQNFEASKAHCQNDKKQPFYINDMFENYANNHQDKKFDIICAIEVIEHANNWTEFLDLIDSLLKPGGLIFLSTLNRNFKSYILGIIAAEYILGLLPKKTHSWDKFLKPSEVISHLNSNLDLNSKYKIINMKGIEFSILKNSWNLTQNLDVNYILCLQKI